MPEGPALTARRPGKVTKQVAKEQQQQQQQQQVHYGHQSVESLVIW